MNKDCRKNGGNMNPQIEAVVQRINKQMDTMEMLHDRTFWGLDFSKISLIYDYR